MLTTTAGQLLVNSVLPPDLRDYQRTLDKGTLKKVLGELARRHPDRYRDVVKQLGDIGRQAATLSGGNSFGLVHLRKSRYGRQMAERLARKVAEIVDRDDYQGRKLTDKERNELIVRAVGEVMVEQYDKVFEEAKSSGNPLALQLLGAGRGNKANLASLLSADLLYTDQHDQTLPVPVLHSYSEGLRPHEYWAGTYGARRGVLATKLAVRDAGFLSKQLNQISHRLVVEDDDDPDAPPDTIRGLPVSTEDSDNEGALLAQDVTDPKTGKVIYKRNTVLTPKILQHLRTIGRSTVLIRSPIVSHAPGGGLFARDVGVREYGTLPGRGTNVGLTAAQALSEPISQGQLSAKHSGGVAGQEHVVSGFQAINQMIQVPAVFRGGATHTEADGKVERVEPAPQGGHYVVVAGRSYYVPQEQKVLVKPGDDVEAGDVLSTGEPNPAIVVRYKGLGEGRRYFVEAFRKTLERAGTPAHRRNIEILARGLINHVELTDETDDHVPGDVVLYSQLERSWKPREGHRVVPLRQAAGKYLERPVLHYSIGTPLKPSVIKRLEEFGIREVDVHDEPPPFRPVMVRGMYSLRYDPDPITRMYGSGLKTSLLDAVHRGSVSDETGTSFVPGLARAVDFGRKGLVRPPEPGTPPPPEGEPLPPLEPGGGSRRPATITTSVGATYKTGMAKTAQTPPGPFGNVSTLPQPARPRSPAPFSHLPTPPPPPAPRLRSPQADVPDYRRLPEIPPYSTPAWAYHMSMTPPASVLWHAGGHAAQHVTQSLGGTASSLAQKTVSVPGLGPVSVGTAGKAFLHPLAYLATEGYYALSPSSDTARRIYHDLESGRAVDELWPGLSSALPQPVSTVLYGAFRPGRALRALATAYSDAGDVMRAEQARAVELQRQQFERSQAASRYWQDLSSLRPLTPDEQARRQQNQLLQEHARQELEQAGMPALSQPQPQVYDQLATQNATRLASLLQQAASSGTISPELSEQLSALTAAAQQRPSAQATGLVGVLPFDDHAALTTLLGSFEPLVRADVDDVRPAYDVVRRHADALAASGVDRWGYEYQRLAYDDPKEYSGRLLWRWHQARDKRRPLDLRSLLRSDAERRLDMELRLRKEEPPLPADDEWWKGSSDRPVVVKRASGPVQPVDAVPSVSGSTGATPSSVPRSPGSGSGQQTIRVPSLGSGIGVMPANPYAAATQQAVRASTPATVQGVQQAMVRLQPPGLEPWQRPVNNPQAFLPGYTGIVNPSTDPMLWYRLLGGDVTAADPQAFATLLGWNSTNGYVLNSPYLGPGHGLSDAWSLGMGSSLFGQQPNYDLPPNPDRFPGEFLSFDGPASQGSQQTTDVQTQSSGDGITAWTNALLSTPGVLATGYAVNTVGRLRSRLAGQPVAPTSLAGRLLGAPLLLGMEAYHALSMSDNEARDLTDRFLHGELTYQLPFGTTIGTTTPLGKFMYGLFNPGQTIGALARTYADGASRLRHQVEQGRNYDKQTAERAAGIVSVYEQLARERPLTPAEQRRLDDARRTVEQMRQQDVAAAATPAVEEQEHVRRISALSRFAERYQQNQTPLPGDWTRDDVLQYLADIRRDAARGAGMARLDPRAGLSRYLPWDVARSNELIESLLRLAISAERRQPPDVDLSQAARSVLSDVRTHIQSLQNPATGNVFYRNALDPYRMTVPQRLEAYRQELQQRAVSPPLRQRVDSLLNLPSLRDGSDPQTRRLNQAVRRVEQAMHDPTPETLNQVLPPGHPLRLPVPPPDLLELPEQWGRLSEMPSSLNDPKSRP